MRTKLKAVAAALLSTAMLLTATACDEEGASVAGDGDGNDPTAGGNNAQMAQTSSTFANNEEVDNAVNNIDINKLDNPDLKVEKRIKWLAWWAIDESVAAATLFKNVYGVPANGDDPDSAGQIFENWNTVYENRYTDLAAYVAADNSPDLFPFEIRDFPNGAIVGRYQPIDNVVNLDSPKWANTKDLIEKFELGGKHYCAFYEISMNNFLYYRKSMIDEIGVKDPYQMFLDNEWTWDAFLEIGRKWQSSGATAGIDRYLVDGYNPEDDFLVSTGVPMVENKNGQLVSNLYDSTFERFETNLLMVLAEEELRYPRDQLNGWSVNPKAWATGQILFYGDGATWVYDTLYPYSKKYDWDPSEINVVPFPRDPQADAYYVNMKQDSLMFVKGSKNPEGVQAWIDCCVTSAQDPAVREASFNQVVENKHWNPEMLRRVYDWTDITNANNPLTFIVDFKGGLGTVSDASATQNPVQSLTNLVYLGLDSFTQLREMHAPAINLAIEEANKFMAG